MLLAGHAVRTAVHVLPLLLPMPLQIGALPAAAEIPDIRRCVTCGLHQEHLQAGCMALSMLQCLSSLCSAVRMHDAGHKAQATTVKVLLSKHHPESGPFICRADHASHKAGCPGCYWAWLKYGPCMST